MVSQYSINGPTGRAHPRPNGGLHLIISGLSLSRLSLSLPLRSLLSPGSLFSPRSLLRRLAGPASCAVHSSCENRSGGQIAADNVVLGASLQRIVLGAVGCILLVPSSASHCIDCGRASPLPSASVSPQPSWAAIGATEGRATTKAGAHAPIGMHGSGHWRGTSRAGGMYGAAL